MNKNIFVLALSLVVVPVWAGVVVSVVKPASTTEVYHASELQVATFMLAMRLEKSGKVFKSEGLNEHIREFRRAGEADGPDAMRVARYEAYRIFQLLRHLAKGETFDVEIVQLFAACYVAYVQEIKQEADARDKQQEIIDRIKDNAANALCD
ncbi:MAG TPA: hypothetical protein VLG71_00250 [Candidatus Limnocylindria bacterium]|nr:hypothetical protein [Candidatus Limnocylindria bacterium]